MNEIKQIKSKLPGQFAANEDGKVYYVHTVAINIGGNAGNEDDEDGDVVVEQPYTNEEIDALISTGEWIPVANADELNQIRQDGVTLTFGAGTDWEGQYVSGLDKKYIQVADVDLSSFSSGEGWTPLGIFIGWENPLNTLFSGIYDGGNYTISNLLINKPDSGSTLGLFGQGSGFEIRNLKITDSSVTGASWDVGILIGYSPNTLGSNIIENITIENSAVKSKEGDIAIVVGAANNLTLKDIQVINCTLEAEGSWGVGMVAGYADSSGQPFENLYVQGQMTLTGDYGEDIGGAFGAVEADIYNVFVDVNITDNTDVGTEIADIGGFAGYYWTSNVAEKIEAHGDIEGSMYIGGIFGMAGDATILNSFSTGNVSGNDYIGGIVGAGDNLLVHSKHRYPGYLFCLFI